MVRATLFTQVNHLLPGKHSKRQGTGGSNPRAAESLRQQEGRERVKGPEGQLGTWVGAEGPSGYGGHHV